MCTSYEERSERNDAHRLYLPPSRRHALVSQTIQRHHIARREREGVGERRIKADVDDERGTSESLGDQQTMAVQLERIQLKNSECAGKSHAESQTAPSLVTHRPRPNSAGLEMGLFPSQSNIP